MNSKAAQLRENGIRPLRSSAFVIWGKVLPRRAQTFGDNFEELRMRKQGP